MTPFYLESNRSQACEEASHQWLHSRIIVFVNSESIRTEEADKT